MRKIKLADREWSFDPDEMLGPKGGFGAVYRGQSDSGEAVAVKRLNSTYYNREMRIADYLLGHGLSHVIPILAAGFDSDDGGLYIVMPVATMSLQQHINSSGRIEEAEAIDVLIAIAVGLKQIGDIIHRDLKPGNVLLHEGTWKLADLGLARFAEAATSLQTMRDALTPMYAAPEQWRGERPSKVTDIYALGCIAHALIEGAPPFGRKERVDLAHEHQFVTPPELNCSAHLRRIVSSCLSKSLELRPSVESLVRQLENSREARKRAGFPGLAAAAAQEAREKADQEERHLAMRRDDERRKVVSAEAIAVLEGIFKELEGNVLLEVPTAHVGPEFMNHNLRAIKVRQAELVVGIILPSKEKTRVPDKSSGMAGSRKWDVYAAGYIAVQSTWMPRQVISANLWFGQLIEGDDNRWWEVAYDYPKSWSADIRDRDEPFGSEKFHDSNPYLVAHDPIPVTPDAVDDFVQRWIDLFARAAGANHWTAREIRGPRGQAKPLSSKFLGS